MVRACFLLLPILSGLLVSCGEKPAKSAEASTVSRPVTEASGLARRIEAPLLGELKALLRDGRKISAIKRYREVSRKGLMVAKSVIDVLEAEVRADSSE